MKRIIPNSRPEEVAQKIGEQVTSPKQRKQERQNLPFFLLQQSARFGEKSVSSKCGQI